MKKVTLPFLVILGIVGFIAFTSKPNSDASDDAFVGKPGPQFQVEGWISPKPELEGKFLLIDFWATWCGPCLRAMPHLNELHAEFKDQLTIVGLSNESRAKVEAMKSPVMDYYSAIDTQGRMAGFFQIRSIPHIVLLNPQGVVLWKGHPARLSKDQIQKFLSKA